MINSTERLRQAVESIYRDYPHGRDQTLRDDAQRAAEDYIDHHGSIPRLESAGRKLASARDAEARARAALRQLVIMHVNDGMPVATVARHAGVDRMTAMNWTGRIKR